MNKNLLAMVAVALLAGPVAANAVPVTYDLTVNATSGSLAGAMSSGFFTFDDSIIPVGDGFVLQTGLLLDLAFTWDGIAYDESTANTGLLGFTSGALTTALFGTNCGAGYCFGSSTWIVQIQPLGVNNFFYGDAAGTAVFSQRVANVPEPGTLALFGLGLVGLGFARRRRATN